jgi:hypothetical protein
VDTVVAVFDGRLAAAAALRELHAAGVTPVQTWQASGLAGARRIRLASEARSLLRRIVRAIGDRGTMGEELADWAATGHTVLAVQMAGGMAPAVSLLAERATSAVRIGRWVTERVG